MQEKALIEELLLPSEVAKILRLGEGTLANSRMENKGIPFCKAGKSVRYKKSDVLKYIEDGMSYNNNKNNNKKEELRCRKVH